MTKSVTEAPSALRRLTAGAWFRLGVVAVLFGVAIVAWFLDVAQTKQQAARDRARLVERQQQELDARTEELLRVEAATLQWAVDGAMASGDKAALGAHVRSLVKQPHVELVVVADSDGVVQVASNAKLEGSRLSDSFPSLQLPPREVAIVRADGDILVIAPLEGGGSTVMVYSAAPPA